MLLLLIFLSHSLIFRCQFDVCSSRNSSTIKLSLLHHVLSAVCGSYNFRVVTTHNRVSPRTKFSREGADGKILGKMRRNFLLSTFLSRVLVMYRHYQHCKISLKIFYWTYKNIWMKYERLIYIFIDTSSETGSWIMSSFMIVWTKCIIRC